MLRRGRFAVHVETGGAGGGDAATGRMVGGIARFRAEAAAGRVSIDPESAESMAARIDAIRGRVARMPRAERSPLST
ncbi:hypothetical protein [Actinoalloteichus sp. AHMU CJ021]|uniref:hypothetical protein n=1 Tax=Actinoalloteichus sp. AHMU CJ021 TaxID=2072503 RepID=UPI00307BC64E